MGIKGLLDPLKPFSRSLHVSDYAGHRVSDSSYFASVFHHFLVSISLALVPLSMPKGLSRRKIRISYLCHDNSDVFPGHMAHVQACDDCTKKVLLQKVPILKYLGFKNKNKNKNPLASIAQI